MTYSKFLQSSTEFDVGCNRDIVSFVSLFFSLSLPFFSLLFLSLFFSLSLSQGSLLPNQIVLAFQFRFRLRVFITLSQKSSFDVADC